MDDTTLVVVAPGPTAVRLKRRILLLLPVIQRLPSGPVTMKVPPNAASVNSVATPLGVMRPMVPVNPVVYQRLPSGPVVMPLPALVTGSSVMSPASVIAQVTPVLMGRETSPAGQPEAPNGWPS